MEYKDYYKLMGVERDATQDEIKRAYRKLARKYHPDVSTETDAEARFKEVNEAYEALKDPEKRAAYDQLGKSWKQGEDFRPPPDWDAGFEFSGGGYTGGDAAAFSDFFESLFGHASAQGGYQGSRHAPGEDHHARVLIDIEDSWHSAQRAITLQVPQVDAAGHVITQSRTLNVRIPKGIKEGQRIRLAGQGAPALGGAHLAIYIWRLNSSRIACTAWMARIYIWICLWRRGKQLWGQRLKYLPRMAKWT